ncbi:MAG: hypothetical protein HWN68_13075 [Desulfobacterales bacterium]|nr:hypothetical protein [Desulfobacterales bacterium]
MSLSGYTHRILEFRKAVVTKDIYKADRIADDPSDNKFLARALKGKADFIVSRYPGISI